MGWGREGEGLGLGGQGGCERRIFFLGGGGVGGRGRVGGWVRVDVNEIEVFLKIRKKKNLGGWVGGGGGGGGGRVGGSE